MITYDKHCWSLSVFQYGGVWPGGMNAWTFAEPEHLYGCLQYSFPSLSILLLSWNFSSKIRCPTVLFILWGVIHKLLNRGFLGGLSKRLQYYVGRGRGVGTTQWKPQWQFIHVSVVFHCAHMIVDIVEPQLRVHSYFSHPSIFTLTLLHYFYSE